MYRSMYGRNEAPSKGGNVENEFAEEAKVVREDEFV